MSTNLDDTFSNKRDVEDRRTVTWRTVFFGFTRSRRRGSRRELDGEVVFLDWHHPWLFFLAVGTMLLSCADAFMTLQLLQRGMIEANPVMAVLLGHGTTTFIVSKMLMTGVSILILVFVAKARFLNRMRTGVILTVFFSAYACLTCYEFVQLMSQL